jgi:hypothetical protein
MRWRRSRCSGREHVVIIRPTSNGMVLHTMYYEDELHKANQPALPKEERYSQKEIDLARRLIDRIDALASPFNLGEYHFLTPHGWKLSRLFARLEARVFRPAMAAFGDDVTGLPPPLRTALGCVDRELAARIQQAVPFRKTA